MLTLDEFRKLVDQFHLETNATQYEATICDFMIWLASKNEQEFKDGNSSS